MDLNNGPGTEHERDDDQLAETYDEYVEQEQPSAFDRFAWVFYAPVDAFDGLLWARRGSVIGWGLAILVVVSLASTLLTMAKPVLVEQQIAMRMEPLEEQYEAGEISKEDYERAQEMMGQSEGSGFRIIGAVGSVIMTVLLSLLVAVVLLTIAKLLETDKDNPVGFGVAMAVFLISSMISSLGRLIESVGIYLTENVLFALDASVFADPSNMFAFILLKNIGLFPIWWMIVTGIGVAVVTGADRTRAIATVVGVWMGLMLLFAGISQLLSNLF